MIINSLDPIELIAAKVKNARKALGISQKHLARLSGLSQSEIAKLEKEPRKLNPNYVTLFNIIEAINDYGSNEENAGLRSKEAYEIMHKHIVYARPNDNALEAFEIMRSNDFSQLPVMRDNDIVIGTVYQRKLLKLFMEYSRAFTKIKIKDIMDGALPQVDKNTPIMKIKPILENWDAVLVSENEHVVGIITLYDLFKAI